MPIAILPLLTVSEQALDDLKEELGNSFLSKVIVLPRVVSLPDGTYDKSREQYDANKVLTRLKSETKGAKAEKIIAVGNIDMFVGGLNYVFGVAEKGGRMCVVSLYRLDQRFYGRPASYERFKERAVKEAIHELGHCYGLDHCKSKKCVMVFSNDIISVDTKSKSFCEGCRERLRKAL